MPENARTKSEPPLPDEQDKGSLNGNEVTVHSELDHKKLMERAIRIAQNAPRRPFGALIVDIENKSVLAEGWNRTDQNPTWHGEIDAINRLAETDSSWKKRSLTLYTTAEPCPMCMGAILWTGIETVVFGTSISYLADLGWDQIDLGAEALAQSASFRNCRIIPGILEQECNALFDQARQLHQS